MLGHINDVSHVAWGGTDAWKALRVCCYGNKVSEHLVIYSLSPCVAPRDINNAHRLRVDNYRTTAEELNLAWADKLQRQVRRLNIALIPWQLNDLQLSNDKQEMSRQPSWVVVPVGTQDILAIIAFACVASWFALYNYACKYRIMVNSSFHILCTSCITVPMLNYRRLTWLMYPLILRIHALAFVWSYGALDFQSFERVK